VAPSIGWRRLDGRMQTKPAACLDTEPMRVAPCPLCVPEGPADCSRNRDVAMLAMLHADLVEMLSSMVYA
jgi:hypothetical protein